MVSESECIRVSWFLRLMHDSLKLGDGFSLNKLDQKTQSLFKNPKLMSIRRFHCMTMGPSLSCLPPCRVFLHSRYVKLGRS